MKRPLLLPACLLLIAVSLAAQTPHLEIVWRKSTLHPVAVRTLYRFATCPDGLTLTTSTNGDFLAVDSDGIVRADRQEEDLTHTTASTCDPEGRLIVLTEGWLKSFNVSDQADLELIWQRRIGGGPGRLTATPNGNLYVVGMASHQGRHVFLRRFRLDDEEFVEIPDVGIVFSRQAGFNSFAVNGSVTWNAHNGEALFAAANPATLWRLRPGAEAEPVSLSQLAFQDAANLPDDYRAFNWQTHDWIRNLASLPDGRVVAQVFRGRGNPPPDGESFAYLFILDEDYRTVTGKLALAPQPFLGLFSGVDTAGNLYFVDLAVNSVATVTKARLVP